MNRLLGVVSPRIHQATASLGIKSPIGFALVTSVAIAAITSGAFTLYAQGKEREVSGNQFWQNWLLSFAYAVPQTLLGMALGIRYGGRLSLAKNIATEPLNAAIAVAQTEGLAAAGIVEASSMGVARGMVVETLVGAAGSVASHSVASHAVANHSVAGHSTQTRRTRQVHPGTLAILEEIAAGGSASSAVRAEAQRLHASGALVERGASNRPHFFDPTASMAAGAFLVVQGPGGGVTRKIPATMGTRHPDNAKNVRWGDSPFVAASDEGRECLHDLRDLHLQEGMFDWEGRLADGRLLDRMLPLDPDFFRRCQIGRDVFLTVRVPNLTHEGGEGLAMAFVTMVSAAHTAERYGLHRPPMFEAILPMTSSAQQLHELLKIWPDAVRLGESVSGRSVIGINALEVIPLFERTEVLFDCRKVLDEYVAGYEQLRGRRPSYLRPFIARSDPAVDAGYVAARLAARGALSEVYRFQEESGIPVFPILGAGSLPFRGEVSPLNLDAIAERYRGVQTVTVQSAFRYDYEPRDVETAIRRLNDGLLRGEPTRYSPGEILKMRALADLFTKHYRPVVHELSDAINWMASLIPSHRERLPETGVMGYARRLGEDGVRLPRAIKFAAVFYSWGIPPEFIGTGRAIREAIEGGQEQILLKYLPTLKEDLKRCGRYLNREVLEGRAKQGGAWARLREDIQFIEDWIGERLGPDPTNTDQLRHESATGLILAQQAVGRFDPEILRESIMTAGRARRSLG